MNISPVIQSAELCKFTGYHLFVFVLTGGPKKQLAIDNGKYQNLGTWLQGRS